MGGVGEIPRYLGRGDGAGEGENEHGYAGEGESIGEHVGDYVGENVGEDPYGDAGKGARRLYMYFRNCAKTSYYLASHFNVVRVELNIFFKLNRSQENRWSQKPRG